MDIDVHSRDVMLQTRPDLEELPTDEEVGGGQLLRPPLALAADDARGRRRCRNTSGAIVLAGLALAGFVAVLGRDFFGFPASVSKKPGVVVLDDEGNVENVTSRVGSDCWPSCGRSGWCDYCGAGFACCRKNYPGSPEECAGVGGDYAHRCVFTLAHAGEQCAGQGMKIPRNCTPGYTCQAVDVLRSECQARILSTTVGAYAECSWEEGGSVWEAPCIDGTTCQPLVLDRARSLCMPGGLLHPGEDCWFACGGKGGIGACDWCGRGNACCKNNSFIDPPECAGVTFLQNVHHECVVPKKGFMPDVGPKFSSDGDMGLANAGVPSTFSSNMPAAFGRTPVLHWGQDCWAACGAAGDCASCGPGNACCKKGELRDPPECKGVSLFGSEDHHVCVAPVTPVRVKHYGQDCWNFCKSKGGYCDWCGVGNACCVKGLDSPAECAGVTQFPVSGIYTCVSPARDRVTCAPGLVEDRMGNCAMPSEPVLMSFYVYHVEGDSKETVGNMNVANLAGVMWYLHNEVVTSCPRHNMFTRIRRLKLTMKNTNAVYSPAPHAQFGPYFSFQEGKCEAPTCDTAFSRFGYTVGCQVLNTQMAHYQPTPVWYSLPGQCPSEPFGSKDGSCILNYPGGECHAPDGTRNCTWHIENAGEVMLDDLSGIGDFTLFCEQGKVEYDPDVDHGKGTTFWDDKDNPAKCKERVKTVQNLFELHYPTMPSSLHDPVCDWWR